MNMWNSGRRVLQELLSQPAVRSFSLTPAQVNGMDTVRIPVSIVPYEDQSASSQRQLKTQRRQQAAPVISEPADVEEAAVKAVSDAAVEAEAFKDPMSEASASAGEPAAEEMAASTQSEETTAPPSDSPKKDSSSIQEFPPPSLSLVVTPKAMTVARQDALASSQSTKTYLSPFVSPGINWQPVQDVPRPHPISAGIGSSHADSEFGTLSRLPSVLTGFSPAKEETLEDNDQLVVSRLQEDSSCISSSPAQVQVDHFDPV